MSLQFILGNSGSGKSYTLYQTIITESMQHPEKNYLVIVPEQFTMQTQKDLVMQHPDRGIMNIDVLSFRRLAHRIFEEVGADRRTVLTETGKNLMLRKVAIEQQDKLLLLGGRMSRPGYISEVKSALSELMQYEITNEDMEELLQHTEKRPMLHTKLADLSVLYQAFLDYQKERFMKPEELLDVLCKVADRSLLLKNSIIALDGYTGFTPSQLNVIQKLLELCPKLYVTVTIDVREPIFGEILEHELFALSKKTIQTVQKAAQEVRAEIEEPILLGKEQLPRFSKNGELRFLEQHLFRNKRSIYIAGCTQKEISLHASSSPADEVHFAARTISHLVRKSGYRYQDIAVITGNLNSYDHYVKKIFPMYEVPAFLDETRHILLNPCLEFVRGALAVVQKDFSYETVFRFLRTQMAGVTTEELDVLENYVLETGVRGQKKWSEEWTYLPHGRKQEELEQINLYRSWAMQHLLPFAEKIKQKNNTLKQQADALCELLEDCGIQQLLKDRELQLSAQKAAMEEQKMQNNRELAREYSQIYSILIHLLEEMVELLGEERVSVQEFGEILDAGLSEASVGIIPPGIDQVQVGDITRSRLNHVKVLFFLGLNDGWVPSGEVGGGIVSDMERELLRETGIELAPSARENSYIQRFYLYQNLTKPEDRLYLSWCCSSGDGSAMRPSYLAGVIQRMFPELKIQVEKEAGSDIRQITSKENGMLYFTRGLQELRSGKPDSQWMELYNTYLLDEKYKARVSELVRAAFTRASRGQLTYQTSRELYGETMNSSVTRLEQFAACAFAHFAAYGLHLGERELHGVKASDLGILFHRAMELFSRRIQLEGYQWNNIPEEIRAKMVETCVDEITNEYNAGIFHGSARDHYTVYRMKRILSRTVWVLHEQIKAGSFVPTDFEVSFAQTGNLEAVHVRFGENGSLQLQGRIDRIDTAETKDAIYVKIVDYKSGNTKFDPVSVYYGLQLQLVVYLNAALEMEQKRHPEKEIIPAGIFYHHLDDPVLDKEGAVTETENREKLLKELRPDGLLNADGEILHMLDRTISGDSLYIPAGLKRDGSLKAASSAISTEQFRLLSEFVSQKMQNMTERIIQGEVQAEPYADKKKSACDYCEFSDVCGFDRKIPGMCKRRLPSLKKDDVWELIAREQEESDGS